MVVDARGEYVMSDEICHRNNGKQEKRRRGGRSVQLLDWLMNKISRQHIHYCSYLGHENEVSFVGGISERRPNVSLSFSVGSFVLVGLISTREGGMEGGREVLNE